MKYLVFQIVKTLLCKFSKTRFLPHPPKKKVKKWQLGTEVQKNYYVILFLKSSKHEISGKLMENLKINVKS